jgi:hypothetical protein
MGKKFNFSITSDKYDLERAPKAPPRPIKKNFIAWNWWAVCDSNAGPIR